MRRTRFLFGCATIVTAISTVAIGATASSDWHMVPGVLHTQWADDVNVEAPLPEYPRPQLVRDTWTNLNGLWQYAITTSSASPQKFDGTILVPFPLESSLSGVGKTLKADETLWYRRTFYSPPLTDGQRLLLHFGAVDWEIVVSVNSQVVGSHRGGYDPFTFDITHALRKGENEIIVLVHDASGASGEVQGKQNLHRTKPFSPIQYTTVSGIWQTVWLEPVSSTHIEALSLVPDVASGALHIHPILEGNASGYIMEVRVFADGQEVAHTRGEAGTDLSLAIPNARLWSPTHPFLYDLSLSLLRDGSSVDLVRSYFGMRSLALGTDEQDAAHLLLNGEQIFQAGVLDQGYWPEGIYTAPTDDAMRTDLETIKSLGFNTVRKHVKVEPDRWYYWCDRLGLLVWQDMPNGEAGIDSNFKTHEGERKDDATTMQFEHELSALIETHSNHPSIVLWILFNEGWGQYETARLTQAIRRMDPTRLVTSASGGFDVGGGDIEDIHLYTTSPTHPGATERAAVLGEFGGITYSVADHLWTDRCWGYSFTETETEFLKAYEKIWKQIRTLRDQKNLSGAIYTQLTDVETECNGLLTYDHIFKAPIEQLRGIVERVTAP